MSANPQITDSKPWGGATKSLARVIMKSHVSLYRLTGGKVGGGQSHLILTTTGRKSGVERDTPLFFFADGDHYIIIGSMGGAPKHPTWWLNLKSNPQAKIQIGPKVIPVTAREAEGEERKRLWGIIAENYKNFVGYQQRTVREIPVIILEPQQA
jgi:deazaflavin-dependent oxidoreductase (nitroreductase family)